MTWTLLADSEERTEAFETKCLRCSASPTWSTRPTTVCGARSTSSLTRQKPLLATIERRKLAWFEHVTRNNSLSEIILQGLLECGRRRGRQMECWVDNVKEWTSLPLPGLLTVASRSKRTEENSAESPLVFSLSPTTRSVKKLT